MRVHAGACVWKRLSNSDVWLLIPCYLINTRHPTWRNYFVVACFCAQLNCSGNKATANYSFPLERRHRDTDSCVDFSGSRRCFQICAVWIFFFFFFAPPCNFRVSLFCERIVRMCVCVCHSQWRAQVSSFKWFWQACIKSSVCERKSQVKKWEVGTFNCWGKKWILNLSTTIRLQATNLCYFFMHTVISIFNLLVYLSNCTDIYEFISFSLSMVIISVQWYY